ncbi:MAG: hypothetical protein ATN31_07915 [Candidatus Epulonipiscioides saccharophilum]|nr:MAG: hypothetical protein ATN31_07915 [Epulopiscium sp. AS2M-Bin001]
MNLGLYIHIPFCRAKCYYCDFLSFSDNTLEKKYIDALITELKIYSKNLGDRKIDTIFIGGGTPSALQPESLFSICEAVEQYFTLSTNLEWTIEANPATLSPAKLPILKNSRINRVSLGLQSTNNEILKKIGRIHTFEDWQKTVNDLFEIGITNINTDLMFALPDQTLSAWQNTLIEVCKFDISHISAYSLILEDNTRLSAEYKSGRYKVTPEELDRQMYSEAKRILNTYGFRQYEISNWARDNKLCRHNMIYWTLDEYIGLGLGASGYINNIRYTNTTNLKKYIQELTKDDISYVIEEKNLDDMLHVIEEKNLDDMLHIIEEKNLVTMKMSIEEFMFLGLRLSNGISKDEFRKRFGIDIKSVYKNEIAKWLAEKALLENDSYFYLTNFGIDISNTVFASFLDPLITE